MKSCSKCKTLKSLEQFHKYKNNLDGRHSICKTCRSEYNKNLKYIRPKKGRMKCSACSIVKEVCEFYSDTSSSSGLQSYCKTCLKEKIYESQSKLENFINKIYTRFKRKYKEKTSFTKGDLLELYNKQNKRCNFTDELLTYYIGPSLTDDKYESKFNISINIKDIKSPFTIDNIELIGETISKMKHDLTNNEFIRLCKLISEK